MSIYIYTYDIRPGLASPANSLPLPPLRFTSSLTKAREAMTSSSVIVFQGKQHLHPRGDHIVSYHCYFPVNQGTNVNVLQRPVVTVTADRVTIGYNESFFLPKKDIF